METKSTDLNQRKSPNAANGLILSSATTKLQKEWELLPLGRLGVTGNTLKLKLQASAAADKPMQHDVPCPLHCIQRQTLV